MKVDYSQPTTPAEYKCGTCQKTGVKLWREYNTVAPVLRCALCAAQEQHEDIRDMDADGCHTSTLIRDRTDQIGDYVPAVPDEEGIGFWGYTSIPAAGVRWWRALPLKMMRRRATQNDAEES